MSTSKRFKPDYTCLERLPNELFVEIFGYLTGVDATYAFSQLNYRFQQLLLTYVNTFDFQSVSKLKFDYVTKHHDIQQWQSLRLSNNDQTPGQIRLFSQLYSPLQYLSQLQVLSLINIESKLIEEYFSPLVSYDQLISLTIGNICGENMQSLELPSLKRLVINACKHTDWIMNFPHLEKLEFTIKYNCFHGRNPVTLPTTLTQLKIFYIEENDGNDIRTCLRQLSQLTKLILYDKGSRSPLPNGKIWEEIIQSCLPFLKIFQFCFPFQSYHSTSNDMKDVIASFSTPFYLFEKSWFIRCDIDCRYSTGGTLYSLPFAFKEMPINITSFDTSLSTLNTNDIDKIKYNSYEKVKTLLFNEKCRMPDQGFLSTYVKKLILKTALPTNWYFTLTNLHHVEFRRTLHMTSLDFAQFLLNSPQLHSLILPISVLMKLTDKFTNNTVCDLLSRQIQSLTISRYFSDEYELGDVSVRLLTSLVRIFNKSCKHLSLAISANPNTILPILRRMKQLRSLHIRYNPWSRSSINNNPVSWIEHAPTIIHNSDFIHVTDDCHYYIWFGSQL
ncbi:unnamed protein product [Adineta steineri]|uniref:F-box domain-containing protein n=1 Tax=Adineta steineri TaxID=433720 RepID=A0A815JNU7_9BILA|nr:unnamed protein product [Adineta steineri]